MLFKEKKGWEIPEQRITEEAFFRNRRDLIKCIGGTTGLFAATAMVPAALASQNTDQKYQATRNERYTFSRPLTDEFDATTYNNFYEFGSHKSIYKAAQALKTSPWSITIDGLVDNPKKLDWDDLLSQLPIEERVYRHRCVEAWSMIVPWIGFPLSSLISLVKPLSNAKYIVLETIMDKDAMPGLRQHWYPWPYTEGLTLDEAGNELAFMATGVYGKKLPKQMGAPVRLVVPWKYGFKSIKSIVKITLTEQEPPTSWSIANPREYGFYSNVNPEVDHPRWSQATERPLGGGLFAKRIPTRMFNGYEEDVANLYKGMDLSNFI